MFSMFLITQGGGGWVSICTSCFQCAASTYSIRTYYFSLQIGPLITGVIGDRTGNMRYCNAFILACILLPVLGLYSVDVEKGKIEALSTAERDAKEFGSVESVKDDTSS
jgi:Vacuole effluxer Atg22 like